MYRRFIERKILNALKNRPIVLLRGARQTGKTTLVKFIRSENDHFQYISFDNLANLSAAKNDPIGFISRLKKPVILDEIQRVPELFLPIKEDVDENRNPGRYLLTGSADPLLLPDLADSLAGRMRLLDLWPLSQEEVKGKRTHFVENLFSETPPLTGATLECSKSFLLDLLIRGGFPEPMTYKEDDLIADWFNDYASLVLQKDILDLSKIENLSQVPNLLSILASQVGGLLNESEIARKVKLSPVTNHRYLNLLRSLFLVYLLPAWSSNLGKRLVKSPKVYLCDTALQLFVLNIDKERLEITPNLFGSVVENFVILEFLKQITYSDMNIKMYHYRDYKQAEVDLILEGPGGKIVAIEIKSKETIDAKDFKGIKNLQSNLKEKFHQGIVLYSGKTCLPFGERLTALPISSLWKSESPIFE